ncbi:hypothetical protein IAR55_002685 [Kwoniella newhampshirensis]|uniref:RRM domain-containing protein n=1 Tax=Kwoniella newhampshirensis TaxID=1651941 RepID=A0AAW0YZQ7_9TREE
MSSHGPPPSVTTHGRLPPSQHGLLTAGTTAMQQAYHRQPHPQSHHRPHSLNQYNVQHSAQSAQDRGAPLQSVSASTEQMACEDIYSETAHSPANHERQENELDRDKVTVKDGGATSDRDDDGWVSGLRSSTRPDFDFKTKNPGEISSTTVSPPTSRANRHHDGRSGVPTLTSRFVENTISKVLDERTIAESTDKAIVPTYHDPAHIQRTGHWDVTRVAVPQSRRGGHASATRGQENVDVTPTDTNNKPPIASTGWDVATGPPQSEWNKAAQLQKWASGIPPASPRAPPTPAPIPDTALTDGSLSKRNSIVEAPDPVILFYSGDEQEVTPALTHSSETEIRDGESEAPDPAKMSTLPPTTTAKPPTILSVRRTGGSSVPISPVTPQVTGTDYSRRYERRTERMWHPRRKDWWKRPPHPMYSPQFAKQRLLVEFPFPVRVDQVRELLAQHFAKWGHIRATFHYEVTGDRCEKGFVVFDDPTSVEACLADPDRHTCRFRSAPRVAATEMELVIKRSEAAHLTRTVYIRVTGARADERARSASPTRHDRGTSAQATNFNQHDDHATSPRSILPATVCVDAVPHAPKHNFTRPMWSARLRPTGVSIERLWSHLMEATGESAQQIAEVDLRRRIPEREFIPRLCGYFAEVCNIFPPTTKGQGWLVAVGGPQDGRHLMNELQKLPGFLVRWADERDGHYPIDGPEAYPESSIAPRSPTTRLHQELQDGLTLTSPLCHEPAGHKAHEQAPPVPNDAAASSANSVLGSPLIEPKIENPLSPARNTPTVQENRPEEEASPTHPHLHRAVIHTYRGRILKEDTSSKAPRYIDDSAIFVGRLNKQLESQFTLLRRFEKYGVINAIEYSPKYGQGTYASARILFQDKTAAERAITFEHGARSFGSAIKVEIRKVLAVDVQTKEMYVDNVGRAISPSMVSQYSPKSPSLYAPPVNLRPRPTAPLAMPPNPTFAYPMFPYYGVPTIGPLYAPPTTSLPVPLPQTTTAPPYDQSITNPGGTTLQSGMPFPMLCAAWGIGYLPAGVAPTLPFCPQQPIPNPSPPQSPGKDMGSERFGVNTGPLAPQDAAPLSPPSPLGSSNDNSASRAKLAPRGFKEEGGMIKAVYDPFELKQYCEENGIDPPKESPKQVKGGKEDKVTLLPISTGGHDPLPDSRAPSAPSNQYHSLVGPTVRKSASYQSLSSPQQPPQDYARPTSQTRTVPVPIPFSPNHLDSRTLPPHGPHLAMNVQPGSLLSTGPLMHPGYGPAYLQPSAPMSDRDDRLWDEERGVHHQESNRQIHRGLYGRSRQLGRAKYSQQRSSSDGREMEHGVV